MGYDNFEPGQQKAIEIYELLNQSSGMHKTFLESYQPQSKYDAGFETLRLKKKKDLNQKMEEVEFLNGKRSKDLPQKLTGGLKLQVRNKLEMERRVNKWKFNVDLASVGFYLTGIFVVGIWVLMSWQWNQLMMFKQILWLCLSVTLVMMMNIYEGWPRKSYEAFQRVDRKLQQSGGPLQRLKNRPRQITRVKAQ